MNSWLTIKYFNFFGWLDGKIFPWSRLKLRFWDVLGCLKYLLERLAITKYETNGALVEVTIEVLVPSDLSSKIYVLCKVLRQDWIWVKWPSNSRLKSISIPTGFSVQWPLISLTRSYESQGCFCCESQCKPFFSTRRWSSFPEHHEIFLTPVSTSDFFSILSFRTKSDDQPPEDFAKSGYKSNRQVEKSKNITGCSWTTLIYQLNMEISKKAGYKYSQILQKS
jgi:hypothetical protein